MFLLPRLVRGYFEMIVSASNAVYDRRNRGDPDGWDFGAEAAVRTFSGMSHLPPNLFPQGERSFAAPLVIRPAQ